MNCLIIICNIFFTILQIIASWISHRNSYKLLWHELWFISFNLSMEWPTVPWSHVYEIFPILHKAGMNHEKWFESWVKNNLWSAHLCGKIQYMRGVASIQCRFFAVSDYRHNKNLRSRVLGCNTHRKHKFYLKLNTFLSIYLVITAFLNKSFLELIEEDWGCIYGWA